ncbi:MAG: TRAP transporter small permease [Geminicoccaceae bacterium]
MTRLRKTLNLLTGLLAFVGSIGVAALLAVTVLAVVWRYVLKDPIFGIGDLSVLILSVVTAGAIAYGAGTGAHVGVNVIGRVASRAITRWTDALMRMLAASTCALASFALIDHACGIEKACITENLSVEHEPFYYVLSLAMALMALTYAAQFLIGLLHWSGRDPNEIAD